MYRAYASKFQLPGRRPKTNFMIFNNLKKGPPPQYYKTTGLVLMLFK